MKSTKFVKVKMLVSTAYQGPRKEGEEVSVPEDFARRWVKNGIAQYIGEEQGEDNIDEQGTVEQEHEVNDNEDETPAEEKPDYDRMSAKDLYALCKEKGIEVEAKKSKEYYIEKLA